MIGRTTSSIAIRILSVSQKIKAQCVCNSLQLQPFFVTFSMKSEERTHAKGQEIVVLDL